jgi:tetratricopeptide (TPR) repeat protein
VSEILKSEAPPTEEALPLPTVAGYEIVEVLGRGGYGVVYKAIQVKLKRLVALKMILAGSHAGASELARFRTEAEAVGNFQHPNIVQIFETLGPAVDIYALGAMLYEMLTGRVPFAGDNPVEVMIQVTMEEPVPPSRLLTKVPRDLETICLKCLEKEPHRRYGTAQDLADDLARFLNHQPILARPVNAWDRSLKWMKRRRLISALLAGIAIACFAFLAAWGSYQRSVYRHQQVETQHEQDELAQVVDGIRRGQTAVKDQLWGNLREIIGSIENKIDSNASLLGKLDRLELEALEGLRRRLDARDTYENFVKSRDEALFFATLSVGEQAQEKLALAVKKDREALYHVGLSDTLKSELTPEEGFSLEERNNIRSGCYELFLVLADLLVRQKGGDSLDQVRHALRILDQAADLGIQTRALDMRRSRYEELAGTPPVRKNNVKTTSEWIDSAFDHFLVGDDFYKQGKLEEAVREFEKALQLQPGHFWAHFDLSACYIMLDRPHLARDNLNICLDKKKIVWVYLMRGHAEGLLKDYEAAERDFDEAIKLLQKDGEQNQEGFYVLYNNRGIMRIGQHGQFARGEDDLRRAIQVNPSKYHAYLSLALAYLNKREEDPAFRKNNLAEANPLMDEAIRAADDSTTRANLYRILSQLHIKADKYQEAFEDLEKSIALEPETSLIRAKAQVDRGRMLQNQNRIGEALAAYDVALKAHPELIDAYRWRGETLFNLKRYAEAVQAFDCYLEKGGPATAKVYQARALARGQAKDPAGAVEDYTRALTLEREPTAITGMFVNRGQAYLSCQANLPALRDFDEAINRDPQNATAYLGRGLARVRKGDIPEGVRDAEKAFQIESQSPKTTYHAARIFAQAAGKSDSDRERRNREAMERRFFYEDRAVALIRRALGLLPESQRQLFWQENIAEDSALGPIRRTYGFVKLEEQYSQPKGRPLLNGSTRSPSLSGSAK